MTIKDSNDKKLIKHREKDQIMLAEKMAGLSALERLNEIKTVENNLKPNDRRPPDLNDIEIVTADQNIYYEL